MCADSRSQHLRDLGFGAAFEDGDCWLSQLDLRRRILERSIIETNPEALEIASALDRERSVTEARGPLHGIPILVKDNIGPADLMQTTAGSIALIGARPKSDAFVAARLRAGGAILLGKSNLSEWANFRSLRASGGWSARGG